MVDYRVFIGDEMNVNSQAEEILSEAGVEAPAEAYLRTFEKIDRDAPDFSELVSGQVYRIAALGDLLRLDRALGYESRCWSTSDYVRRNARLYSPDVDANIYIPRGENSRR